MLAPLRYGPNQELNLSELDAQTAIVAGEPSGKPLGEIGSLLANALSRPTDFPPLTTAVVPGDRIVLAVGPGIPRAAEVIAGALNYLIDECGADERQICILQTTQQEHEGGDLLAAVSAERRAALEVVTHFPERRHDLGYLAADEAAKPIYFNRRLLDADLILPIMCPSVHEPAASGDMGLLYPIFADNQAQRRHGESAATARSAARGKKKHPPPPAHPESPDWMLGVQFAVQIVPGEGEQILAMFAGSAEVVAREARSFAAQAWTAKLARPQPLIVAALSPELEATWELVVETIARLCQALESGGSLILCSTLREPPPSALVEWAAAGLSEEVPEILKREHVPGWQLTRALQSVREQGSLYLLSDLQPQAVEDLGFNAVSTVDEVAHLWSEANSALVVHNADRVHWEIG